MDEKIGGLKEGCGANRKIIARRTNKVDAEINGQKKRNN